MKYIVDLPKEYISGSSLFGKILSIPIQINGDKNYNVPTSIKITPYTEPDRTQIEDEVWSLAETLIDEMTSDEVLEVTGNRCLFELSYQEAKERYEAWKKEKDEIRVGDEVEYKCDGIVRFVVFGIVGITAYGFKYPCDYDDVGEYCDIDMLTKTGRHFDEIDELLKKMKEE